jgi:hypothetical protein
MAEPTNRSGDNGYPLAAHHPAVLPLPLNRLRHRNTLRRFVGVALLALMLGQWTILVHSIEHAQVPAAVEDSGDTDHAWGHHAGTSACHLVDHLLTGQAPAGEPPTPPCLSPAAMRVAGPAPSIGPSAAFRAYEARGPPRA